MGNAESNVQRNYGWRPDKRDRRDWWRIFDEGRRTEDEVVLDKLPPVLNQLSLGSCTANALAGAYEYDEMAEHEDDIFTPSRLFIYYNERKLEGTTSQDSGASLRDGIKTLIKEGVCPETEWPYDITKFTYEPPQQCYTDALKHRALEYRRLEQSLSQLQRCIGSRYPFVFGFKVYESFESQEVAQSGIMPMPKEGEKVLGGHAVMAVGYSEEKQAFLIRNSWGESWGLSGNFWMPYAYITDEELCSDFWTVRKVK